MSADLNPAAYDVREVPCPSCGAAAGSYCRRPSGHSGPFVDPHAARRHAAHDQWRQEERERYGYVVSGFLLGPEAGGPEAGGPEAAGARSAATPSAPDTAPNQLDLFQ